jgi:hypothetical protein
MIFSIPVGYPKGPVVSIAVDDRFQEATFSCQNERSVEMSNKASRLIIDIIISTLWPVVLSVS